MAKAQIGLEFDADISQQFWQTDSLGRVITSPVEQLLLIEAQNLRLLRSLISFGEKIMASLTDLQAAVAAQRTVVDSTVTLLDGIVERLNALEPTREAIDALVAEVTDQKEDLAAAVAAVPPVTS